MKKIVCDLCEGTEFIKENGMFVCQGCGTKYSLDEAKSMMQEVEGEATPVVAAAPAMSVGNPNQAQIDNILVLATTAYEAQNCAEAESYCNKAIELDAMCYNAWNLKGKAVAWQSKIDNLRIEESAHFFCKAIDFAPVEEKEELKNQAVEELKKLGLALITLRKNRFCANPDIKELNGFSSDKTTIIDALLVLLSHGNVVAMPEGYLDEVAKLMTEAGVAALNMARTAWSKLEHPSHNDFTTYLGWNGNICEVFRQAISTSDDDDEDDIPRYKNLITALNEPIYKFSETRQWNSFLNTYEWVKEYSLNDQAISSRRAEISRCESIIKELEIKIADKKAVEAMKAEAEKQARIKAYWEAHIEEKKTLEAEKAQLIKKNEELFAEVMKLDRQIDATKAELKEKVPSKVEIEKLIDQVGALETRRAGLGLFAGKEKKQIGEEIAALQGRIDSLKIKVREEESTQKIDVDEKIAPIQLKRNELDSEYDALTKRINAIDAELKRDPEE